MTTLMNRLLSDFSCSSGASEEQIVAAEKSFGLQFPEDYRKFMSQSNGGEGFIGEHYLILCQIEDLFSLNRDYKVVEYAPGFIDFASTGGGDGFAFDVRQVPYCVYQMPFVGMSPDDSFLVADSFGTLLERMAATNGPLF